MADTKITALTAITTVDPAVDVLPIVDVSDTTMAASGTTKKITSNQILGAGGTATLASATITGDLTVDTSTLKVTASTDTVTVGATTTDSKFRVVDASYNGLRIGFLPGTANYNLYDATVHEFRTANVTPQQLYTLQASSSVWYDGAGGTRMTLNSTGLGVGTSPSAKLDVRQITAAEGLKVYVNDTGATNIINFRSYDNTLGEVTRYAVACNGVATWSNVGGVAGTAMTLNSTGLGIGTSSPAAALDLTNTGVTAFREIRIENSAVRTFLGVEGSSGRFVGSAANNAYFGCSGAFGLEFATNNNVRMVVDSSGNVGIGVTPSAKLDVQTSAGRFKVENFGASSVKLSSSGSFGFTATEHQFLLGATQSMTLDASGYLLIGTTDTAFTSGAGYKFGPGATPSSGQVGASSSNGDLTYRLYSTGAAAYRFYVGFGGTVFATNTTISAISDARLKENVQDIDVGLGAILALKPRKFDWKAGKGKDIKGDRGFIAQEFEQVFPQLVDEWADPAPEGETPYKSVRQDLIPVLVKAIQELAAEVNALKNA